MSPFLVVGGQLREACQDMLNVRDLLAKFSMNERIIALLRISTVMRK